MGTDSYFCSQDCFKRSWVCLSAAPRLAVLSNRLQSSHKTIHKTKSNILSNIFTPKVVSEPDPATGQYNPFPTFPFTGSLRPVYPLSPRRTVPSSIPYPDYALDGIPRSEQKFVARHNITILNQKEQGGMRKVCRLAREVLDIAARELKPGVTTDYIDEVVHKACLERDVGNPTLSQ
jgi:methionyl aminopeptidase